MMVVYMSSSVLFFFFSSRRRHTRCALVTGVQTCALPICPVPEMTMFPRDSRIEGYDPELAQAIADENRRQEDHVELIASENYASPRVMEAQGSQLTNKYARSEEHTSELQSLMRISYAVFCCKKKKQKDYHNSTSYIHL